MIKKIIILLFFIIFMLNISLADDRWINFSPSFIQSLVCRGNDIWAGTKTGVIQWNINTGEYKKYTTADGLANNNATLISIDRQGEYMDTYSKQEIV